jgi:hypothetical protein
MRCDVIVSVWFSLLDTIVIVIDGHLYICTTILSHHSFTHLLLTY